MHLALALYAGSGVFTAARAFRVEGGKQQGLFFSASFQEERVPAKSNASPEVKKMILELPSEKIQPSKILKNSEIRHFF